MVKLFVRSRIVWQLLDLIAWIASFLVLIATGDASIRAAAKSAGITKIHHVDHHSTNMLGFVATYTVIVYGE